MKKILHAIYTGFGTLVATALMLVGCIDDELVKTNNVVEGVPITVNLTLSGAPVADVTVETKASGSDLSDVGDLVVFIFRNDGTFESVATNYNGSTSLKIVSSKVENGNRLYEVSFSTTSGTKKMLALANIADGGYWEGIINQLTDGYNSKISFDDLKKMVVNLDSDLIAASKTSDGTPPFHMAGESQMLISGWNEGIVFDTSGTVKDNGTYGIPAPSTVILQMRRAMAHINFEIVANPDGAKGTFTPTSYRVYNIPTKSYAINDLQGEQELNLTTNITDVEYIHTASENIGIAQGEKYSFDFYMPENVQEAGTNAITGEGTEQLYQQRDMWNSEGNAGAAPENKDWTHAPDQSTFVVISGTYESKSTATGEDYIGNVEYTIHLGDFSTATGSLNNFSVERNVSYTYNVQVLGVTNIVVEATTDNGENQPGAEGTIYDRSNTEYAYNLDAHYEQVFLEYNLSNIVAELKEQNLSDDELDEAIANQLVLVIQSEAMDHNANGVVNKRGSLKPYKIYADAIAHGEDAAYAKANILNGDMDGRENPSKGFDYKWIEFWPQAGTTIAVYPGMSSWAMDDLSASYGKSQMANQDFYAGATGEGNSEYLKDVYDIIVAMGKAVKSIYNNETITTGSRNGDGIIITNAGTTGEPKYVARFTAFVNEYYYLRHPLTGAKITMWSVLVNKIPREMIIAMSTQTSTDGNSSYSKIHSYISQLSMETFYNDRATNLNAFGIETYNETPLTFYFGTPKSSANLSTDDGCENQKILIGASLNPDWTDYIRTNNGWIKSVGTDHKTHKLDGVNGTNAYVEDNVYSACMSRNRDLNGNGKIDENEVRWYLASLNEYIRIGIGATAISSAARLYIGDKTNLKDPISTEYKDKLTGYPYNEISNGSLYYTSSGADYRVFWAIEKGSYNNEETTSSGQGAWYVKQPLPIRCIRNLPDASGNTENRDISSINGVKSDATFVSHPKSGNEPIVLEFRDRLVSSLYRQRTSQLGIHNEDGKANSYYQGIYVAERFLSNKYKLGDIIGYVGNVGNYSNDGTVENPCWDYDEGGYTRWRVPNLIEMTAMHAAGLLNSCSTEGFGSATCCTQFTKQDVRYGFARSSLIYCPGEIGREGDISGEYRIRCVRDVDEGYGFTTPVGDVSED